MLSLFAAVSVADTVSLTSCDSNDSAQLSMLPTTLTPVPQSSSSSSTVSEDCSSGSSHCKSPPLMASIDLELLRKDDAILELVSHFGSHSPEKLLLDSDVESAADCVNGVTDDAADSAENSATALNGDELLAVVDQTLVVHDEDFESIYSRMFVIPAEQPSAEMSLDDAIFDSLMTIHADESRGVARPVAVGKHSTHQTSSENHVNSESGSAEISIPGQVPLSVTQNPDDCNSSSHPGSSQSVVVNNWVQLPAPSNIRSLSVSSRHVWCVDMSGQVLYSHLRGPGLRWFIVTTASAQQISISPSGSLVWRLDDGLVYAGRHISARQPWGSKWSAVARDVTWISVDDHVAW